MASSTVTPAIQQQNQHADPNQFIVWCDKYIGRPDECISLKSSFILAMDPTTGFFERTLCLNDIDRSIRSEARMFVRIDDVDYWFQAFDDVEKCFNVIEKNIKLNKYIILITSGSKGKFLIPALKASFPDTFIKGYPMYVFCANMIMHPVGDIQPTNTWATSYDYENNILMFDHESDLLARVVLENALRFLKKADDLQQGQNLSNQEQELNENERLVSVLQHLRWAKQMHERHKIISTCSGIRDFSNIDQRIFNLEQNLGLLQ